MASWTAVGFNALRVFTERMFNGDLKSGGRKRAREQKASPRMLMNKRNRSPNPPFGEAAIHRRCLTALLSSFSL